VSGLTKFYCTIALLVTGLLLGILCQLIFQRRFATSLSRLGRLLKQITFTYLAPVTLISIFWILKISDIKLVFLPLVGMAAVVVGGFFGYQAARLLKLQPKQTGSMIFGGAYSNTGMFAGFICYMMFGELGYALVSLYKLLEELTLVIIGCPIANYYGNSITQGLRLRIRSLMTDQFFIIPTVSLVLGVFLNLAGVERPKLFETVNAVIIPLMSFILLFAVGLTLKIRSIRQHLRQLVAMIVIKFGAIPLLITTISWALGYQHILNGLLLKVIWIIVFMPVGFNSLIIASLYGLDEELANSCWMVTTGALIVILPFIFLTVHFL
jgi:predicted permease